MVNRIGLLQESSLHSTLKDWYSLPGDHLEIDVNGFIVDILRSNELIEIQTGNFSQIKQKILILSEDHLVRLVYPIPYERWIIRVDKNDKRPLSKRKSPKKARYEDIFKEVVFIAHLLPRLNIIIDLVMVRDELIYIDDGRGSWRRKGWSILDRKLLEVVDLRKFGTLVDYLNLLPQGLPTQFVVKQLAVASRLSQNLARKMVYSLYRMGGLKRVSKRGNAWIYEKVDHLG